MSRSFAITLLCFWNSYIVCALVCPYGWIDRPNSDSCYLVTTAETRYKWRDASARCESHQSELFSISDEAEKKFIISKLRELSQVHQDVTEWWTGLVNRADGKRWVWSDGSKVNMSVIPWKGQRPQAVNNQMQCTTINMLQFQLTNCVAWKKILCERSKSIPLRCDDSRQWEAVNGSCYKSFTTQRTFSDANALCEQYNAKLPTIDNWQTQVYLWDKTRELGSNIWTGLYTQPERNKVTWKWISGEVFNGPSWWAKNNPGNVQDEVNNTCVELSQVGRARRLFSWYVTTCDSLIAYVCQKPQGVCSDGWLQHQTLCYQFNPKYSLSWPRAKQFCEGQGGELARITSSSHQAFINEYLDQQAEIGFDRLWIGISDNGDDSGTFTWTNQSALGSYLNWAKGYPVNKAGSQDCAFIDTRDAGGKWQTTSDCSQVNSFICSISVNSPVKAVVKPHPHFNCDAGWEVYNGTCYLFNDSDLSWVDARSACQQSGGDLAEIHTPQTQAFLNGRIQGGDYWIGLNDRVQEGNFRWLDSNESITYLNWNKREPNNINSENCVAILGKWGPTQNGKWNDYACDRTFRYICQKNAKNSGVTPQMTTPTPPTWSAKCGAFWEDSPHSDYCYQFNSKLLTYMDAKDVCRHHGGSLASITSLQEQYYISGRLKDETVTAMWIGANDRSQEAGWKWEDGSPFSFFNWDAGEPNDFGHEEDCASILVTTAYWNDYNCERRNGFICKKLGETTQTTSTVTSSPMTVPAGWSYGCDSGWRGYLNSCFLFVRKPVTWLAARSACRVEGGDLASIYSKEENNFILSQLPKSSNDAVWLGLNDREFQMNFRWTDGSKVVYTNWALSEPNNYGGKHEDCVLMFSFTGTWNDHVCDFQAQGYVCRRHKHMLSTTAPPAFSVGCPKNSFGYQSWCYTFNTSPLTWTTAELFCKTRHGHLATVNDRYVQAFLAAELVNRDDVYWIGLTDKATPGQYCWSSNASVTYTPWGRSHNGSERNTCVAMATLRPVGLWQNVDCMARKPFICERLREGFTAPPLTTPAPTTAYVSCPANWHAFNDYCYRREQRTVTTSLSWIEARSYCRGFGGDLASIHNEATNTFLINTVLGFSHHGSFWIGLNDLDRETSYRWSDGTPFMYAKWYNGEPNDFNNNEDCVVINKMTGRWNDENCFVAKSFVCQIRRGMAIPSVTPKPTVPYIQCSDKDWVYYGGYCYYVSKSYGSGVKRTWFSARQFCMAAGGDLLSIHTRNEHNYIIGLITKSPTTMFWIGLNELSMNSYRWSDGSPDNYYAWNKNEPNDAYGGQKCVNMYHDSGLWNDDNCMDINGFICKKTNVTSTPKIPVPTPITNGGCSFGSGVPQSNKCLFIVGLNESSWRSWEGARNACRALSGNQSDIASISSYQEQAFLTSLSRDVGTPLWIGLNALNTGYGHRYFVWQDNSEVSFTNWDKGEPNNLFGYEASQCVEMYTRQDRAGLWNSQNCRQQRGYVCQTFRDTSIPTPTPVSTSCKSGYHQYGSSCYRLFVERKTWLDAEKACENDSGHLVSVNSVYEQSHIDIILYTVKINNSPVWIGLSDSKVKGMYAWSDSWPVWFTRWGQDEPTRGEGDGCVTEQAHKWNDTSCSSQYPFICEINSENPPKTTPAPAGYCQNNEWQVFGDFCYQAFPDDSRSWPEARYLCRHIGMDLVSIHSQKELDFVFNLVEQATATSRYGFIFQKRNIWLGLTNTLRAGFEWSDGSPTNFLRWSRGEPSDVSHTNNEECVEMYRSSGQWNDVDCMQNRAYVCKTMKVFPTTSTMTASTTKQTTSVTTEKKMSTSGKRETSEAGGLTLRPPPWNQPHTPGSQPQSQSSDTTKMSGGEVAGIVMGAFSFLVTVSFVLFLFKRRRQSLTLSPPGGFDNALFSKDEDNVTVSNGDNNTHVYMADHVDDNDDGKAEC